MKNHASYFILILTTLLLTSCATVKKESVKSKKIINPYEENSPLYFGNPSNATTSIDNKTNYLMEKEQFTLSYNSETLCPNWVAWHLSTSDLGDTDRTNDFRADPQLPENWYAVRKSDYSYSSYGFDRGHLCPSADRTASETDNSKTFLMTNMVPQAPDNNRIVWMHFENYERNLANSGNELYIIAGTYGTGATGAKGYFENIPVNTKSGEKFYINIPSYTWKICLVLPEGTDDFNRINKESIVIAINIPNNNEINKIGDWDKHITTIDEIEKLTGYDFLNFLPDEIENILEAKIYKLD